MMSKQPGNAAPRCWTPDMRPDPASSASPPPASARWRTRGNSLLESLSPPPRMQAAQLIGTGGPPLLRLACGTTSSRCCCCWADACTSSVTDLDLPPGAVATRPRRASMVPCILRAGMRKKDVNATPDADGLYPATRFCTQLGCSLQKLTTISSQLAVPLWCLLKRGRVGLGLNYKLYVQPAPKSDHEQHFVLEILHVKLPPLAVLNIKCGVEISVHTSVSPTQQPLGLSYPQHSPCSHATTRWQLGQQSRPSCNKEQPSMCRRGDGSMPATACVVQRSGRQGTRWRWSHAYWSWRCVLL